ncbi:MAG: hypothetical protein NT069_35195, partial [Planctomycetota bacterium]|nr:hypothetical protein [Planctomycetota bacterium]
EESITLQEICFVKSGSVTVGSYTYDEPEDEKDPRLIPFGEIPPIVFSETMGDMEKIVGKKEDAENRDG